MQKSNLKCEPGGTGAARKFMSVLATMVFLNLGCSTQSGDLSDEQSLVTLNSWLYRLADSPLDSLGRPEWGYSVLHQAHPASQLLGFENEENSHFLWLQTTLPHGNWSSPKLYLPVVHSAFEVYLDSNLVYTSGEIGASGENVFQSMRWHLVSLNPDWLGKRLSLRIFSEHSDLIGIHLMNDGVMVGNEFDVIRFLVRANADSIILGFFFIFVGLFSMFVFFRRCRRCEYFLASFGLTAVSIGIFYVVQDRTSQLLVPDIHWRYYLVIISFYFFPVGLFAFVEHAVECHHRRIMRALWIFHLVIALAVISLDLVGLMSLPMMQFYYPWIFIATILIAFAVSMHSAIDGDTSARVFFAGFMLFGLFGLIDLLRALHIFTSVPFISHWGMFIFLLCLGYLLERKFAKDQDKLMAYSRDLELISSNLRCSTGKLQEYSQTLEQKVSDRTRDVDEKNRELRRTLQQLREAQNQLVLKEKMASLGDLVAGVAHEVNNPIGAVNSAADVSKRCVLRIQNMLAAAASLEALKSEPKFVKAVELLAENTRILGMAGERITRIVRSLKNFARLDEAERQKADIHDGLDSTLILLHYEMKNRIQVEKDYGSIPMIHCFPTQLNQVFMNILKNASQAIEDKGTVRIKTAIKNGRAVIEITDSGKGISQDKLQSVFDPGFTTKGVGVGTGLGLSISYNIIQKHKGKLEVESEVGQGTTFRIMLPVE